MTYVAHGRFHWIFMIVLFVFGTTAASLCTEKREAVGDLGNTVFFNVCELPRTDYILIDLYSGTDSFSVQIGRWYKGWYWEVAGNGISSSFYIIHNITSEADFRGTYVYLPDQITKSSEVLLNVLKKAAAPILCVNESGYPLVQLPYILRREFAASVNGILCILSLDESGTFDVSQPKLTSEELFPVFFSTFSVRDQSKPGSYFEHELVFDVTALSPADVGKWTVDVTNSVGTFTVEVTIQGTGDAAPRLCAYETGHPVQLSADFGDYIRSYLCIVSVAWTIPLLDIDINRVTTNLDPGTDSSFGVSAQSDLTNFQQRIVFDVYDMSVADVGYWTVTVNNPFGKLKLDVVIEATGPPQLCRNEDRNHTEYVQTLSANIGSFVKSTQCVVSQDYPQIQTMKHTSSDCKMGTCGSTFYVRAVQDLNNSFVYDIVFEVFQLSNAEVGNWTVDITNNDGKLSINVTIKANGKEVDIKDKYTTIICLSVAAGVLVVVAVALTVFKKRGGRFSNLWLIPAKDGQREVLT